eukprot:g3518.t1
MKSVVTNEAKLNQGVHHQVQLGEESTHDSDFNSIGEIDDQMKESKQMKEKGENGKKETNVDQIGKKDFLIRDLIGWLLLGSVSDALPGFFFSGTILSAMVPNGNSAWIGMVSALASLIAAGILILVMKKIWPDIRVIAMNLLQIIGIVLCLLPFAENMAGIFLLTFGFFTIHATLLSLTVYQAKLVAAMYLFGYGLAPLLGIALVELATVTNVPVRPNLFLIAFVFPAVTIVNYFLIIDRTIWSTFTFDTLFLKLYARFKTPSQTKEPIRQDDHKVVSTGTTNELLITTFESPSYDALNDNTTVALAPEVGPKAVSSEGTPEAAPEATVRSTRNQIRKMKSKDTFQEAQGITIKDRFDAINQIWHYTFLVAAANFLNQFNTNYQSIGSGITASYHGAKNAEDVSNNAQLISHCLIFLVGLTTLIPGSERLPLPTLWIGISGILACSITFILLSTNNFLGPPMVPLAFMFVFGIQNSCFYFVMIYWPLLIRTDRDLKKAYREFQVVFLLMIAFLVQFVMGTINSFLLFNVLAQNCNETLARAYPQVKCTQS